MRVIPVARNLSAIEERCQGQSCLFRGEDYRNIGNKSEKLSWVESE
jgi:hypothetical protein